MRKFFYIAVMVILFVFGVFFAITKINESNLENATFTNPVNVVFITDDKYILPTRTAIRSLISNKNPETQIEINIIGFNLSEKSIKKLESEVKKNTKINIRKVSDEDLHNLQAGSKATPGVSRADNAKFFLSSLLKDKDKVLYMDGDVIVLKDLSEMYNTDLKDNYLGAVDDWQSGWENDPQKRYFNNGVMLLNLKKIREDNLEEKLVEFKKNDTVKRFVTQDAFNTVMTKVLWLPLIYDTFAPEYDSDVVTVRIYETLGDNYDAELYPYKTADEYRNDVTIIHYCGYGNKKPWKKLDFKRKSGRLWYKYAPSDFWKIVKLKGK